MDLPARSVAAAPDPGPQLPPELVAMVVAFVPGRRTLAAVARACRGFLPIALACLLDTVDFGAFSSRMRGLRLLGQFSADGLATGKFSLVRRIRGLGFHGLSQEEVEILRRCTNMEDVEVCFCTPHDVFRAWGKLRTSKSYRILSVAFWRAAWCCQALAVLRVDVRPFKLSDDSDDDDWITDDGDSDDVDSDSDSWRGPEKIPARSPSFFFTPPPREGNILERWLGLAPGPRPPFRVELQAPNSDEEWDRTALEPLASWLASCPEVEAVCSAGAPSKALSHIGAKLHTVRLEAEDATAFADMAVPCRTVVLRSRDRRPGDLWGPWTVDLPDEPPPRRLVLLGIPTNTLFRLPGGVRELDVLCRPGRRDFNVPGFALPDLEAIVRSAGLERIHVGGLEEPQWSSIDGEEAMRMKRLGEDPDRIAADENAEMAMWRRLANELPFFAPPEDLEEVSRGWR